MVSDPQTNRSEFSEGPQTGWDWSTCSLKERLRYGGGLAWGVTASGGNSGSGPQYHYEGGQVPEMFWLKDFMDFFGLWAKVTPKKLVLSCHFLKSLVSENTFHLEKFIKKEAWGKGITSTLEVKELLFTFDPVAAISQTNSLAAQLQAASSNRKGSLTELQVGVLIWCAAYPFLISKEEGFHFLLTTLKEQMTCAALPGRSAHSAMHLQPWEVHTALRTGLVPWYTTSISVRQEFLRWEGKWFTKNDPGGATNLWHNISWGIITFHYCLQWFLV